MSNRESLLKSPMPTDCDPYSYSIAFLDICLKLTLHLETKLEIIRCIFVDEVLFKMIRLQQRQIEFIHKNVVQTKYLQFRWNHLIDKC